MSGSGDVELDQAGGERFTLINTGPGDLHASGAVRQLVVESSGSGDLDLRRMKAGDADVKLHGPGDVHLGPGETVRLTLALRMGGCESLSARAGAFVTEVVLRTEQLERSLWDSSCTSSGLVIDPP